MRKLVMLILLLMCSPGLKAQSYDEWFRQKRRKRNTWYSNLQP